MTSPKVATCSYCGTRAALILRGKERHELSCASCGAPLHDIKIMPSRPKQNDKPSYRRGRAQWGGHDYVERPIRKKSKKKSKKSKVLSEIWDFVEDIFD